MWKAVTGYNKPNQTNNFYPADGDWKMVKMPFKASTVIEEGSSIWIEIVGNNVTGNVTKMGTENAAWADFVWIIAEAISSTDDDYATAWKEKAVFVPTSLFAQSYFKVWAGTFTKADVFKTVEFNADAKSLSVDTAWKGARITKYIDWTTWICVFNLPNTETA